MLSVSEVLYNLAVIKVTFFYVKHYIEKNIVFSHPDGIYYTLQLCFN